MATVDPRLVALVTLGREERNLEYKEGDAQNTLAWHSNEAKEKLGRTVMALANIIGMRQIGPDSWHPEGLSEDVDATYQQDQVLQWINQRGNPDVRLSMHHLDVAGQRFVIIDVAGFDDVPVVCKKGSWAKGGLRVGTLYTRSQILTKKDSLGATRGA